MNVPSRCLHPLAAALFAAGFLLLGGCAQPGPLFSEDFESGQLSPDKWMRNVTGNNVIEVQSDKAAHGKYALCVRCPTPSNATWAVLIHGNLPAALHDHYFGRAYVYITPALPTRHIIFMMTGTPGFPYNRYQEVASANGRWQLTYADVKPPGLREDYHAAGSPPLNRWFCLEWEFNDHPDHARMWVDGQLVFETDFKSRETGATDGLIGGFTDLVLGFRLWGAAPQPFDIYYDDIALDPKRIGQIPGPIKSAQ
jgi:hypothetical protein